MHVARAQHQRMLQDKGRNPHIVGGDWCSLLSELPINISVMMRCLLIGIKDADVRLEQQPSQSSFIAGFLRPCGKSSAKFPHNDEWQPYFICRFD